VCAAVPRLRRLAPHHSIPPAPHHSIPPSLVSIILPARNEGAHIERCVRSLLAQDYPHVEIIAIDDCSEDDTGPILDRLAAGDRRLTVLHGAPLPPGWRGKAQAIVQSYRLARGDWRLFTDADTEHPPWLLAAVMAVVRDSPAVFATMWAPQRHPSLGVYLANLAVFTSIFLVTDRPSFHDPTSRHSLLNDQ
jgi:chlorobactene glucosyltransferase